MGTFNFANRSKRLLAASSMAALSFSLLAALGCSAPQLHNDAFVTINVSALQLPSGSVTQIAAAASNASGVTWSITGGTGCPTSGCGTLSGATATTVNYSSPATIPGQSMTVTIQATSAADSKQTASQVFTIYPEYVQITGPSNTTVTPLTSASFSATVSGDRSNAGVSWSISGNVCDGVGNGASDCGSFSGATTAQATFNAPPAPQLEMVTITATSVDATNESASITLTIPKLAIFVFTPTILPPAIVGQPYDVKVGIVGNTEPYTISISSPLPTGLSAIVSGYGTTCDPTVPNPPTPCEGNTIEFTTANGTSKGSMPAVSPITLFPTVTVTDSSSPALTGGQPLAISVYPAPATGNNLLKGSYAFYGIGFHDGPTYQVSQNPIYYIGSFTADGNGNITGGELDVNDSQSVTGITSYTSLGGTYNLQYGNDSSGNPLPGYQTGYITLVPPGKPPRPITMAVALNGIQYASGASATSPSATDVASGGNFIQYDDVTGIGVNLSGYSSGIRVSGSLAQQSAASGSNVLGTTSSPFSGGYAYGLNGFSAVQDFPLASAGSKDLLCSGAATCGPISIAGSMMFGSDGAISSGLEDVLVGEQHSQIGLSGSVSNSGNTDANGRATATINTAATSTMPDWPTDYAIYAVSPQKFYYMSIDSNLTNTMVAGEADQQNLADIASNPFGSDPVVMYVNENGAGNFNDSGTNGQDRVLAQLVNVTPSNATSGSMAGHQWANLSGTYTSNSGNVGTISPATWAYTVSPSTGLVQVPNAAGHTVTEPCLYLIDTSKGWGTQCGPSQQPGLWYAQPQTSTTLNPGWYTYSVYSQIEPVSPLEVGAFYVPGGIGDAGTPVNVTTGTDYTEFENQPGAYVQVTSSNTYSEPMEYTGAITSGTFQETGGIFYALNTKTNQPNGIELFGAGSLATQSTFQGCGQNALAGSGGFVISSTSFMCVPSGGSFGGIHVFQQ